ncbi:hypothetical protein BC834DRAFT_845412 [Gloeopeniophorella convolvens]|nr:hypothetical protein BC834DRAFT_845412 [Gloeopeniophorella convolvens]
MGLVQQETLYSPLSSGVVDWWPSHDAAADLQFDLPYEMAAKHHGFWGDNPYHESLLGLSHGVPEGQDGIQGVEPCAWPLESDSLSLQQAHLDYPSSMSSTPVAEYTDQRYPQARNTTVHDNPPSEQDCESFSPREYLSSGLVSSRRSLHGSDCRPRNAADRRPLRYNPLGYLSRQTTSKIHRLNGPACRTHVREDNGPDHRFVCDVEDCGKRFAGEWERTRHVKSMHCPPTIGCKRCNYKQSRNDLFSEHCKKRHPNVPVEELKVQLHTPVEYLGHEQVAIVNPEPM